MPAFILGEKSEQSQTYTKNGVRIPTTLVRTTSCYLIGLKGEPNTHYFALQLGFGEAKNIKKPQLGIIKKAGIKTPLRFIKEIRVEKYGNWVKPLTEEDKKGVQIGEVKVYVGDRLMPTSFFKPGDKVIVSGTSKGKGFQGVVTRHGFSGGPKTHGQSDRERAPGSIGQSTTPGRVLKGKRMAGRMGRVKTTIKNLEVIEVKEDALLLKGALPGAKTALLEIKKIS